MLNAPLNYLIGEVALEGQGILEALEDLPDLSRELVPQSSLLQEFIGAK